MDNAFEIKKVKAEIARVYARKLEMEIKIDELGQEISRLQSHVDIQEKTESELMEKIEKLKNK